MNSLALVLVAVLAVAQLTLANPAKQISPKFVFEEVSGGGTYRTGETALLKAVINDGGAIDENDDWKVCKWTRQRDGAFCQFNYECDGILCDIGSGNFYVTSVCSPQIASRVSFQGEDPNFHNRICGMQLSYLGLEDSSVWQVDIEQCKVTGCGSDHGNDYIISDSVNVIVQ